MTNEKRYELVCNMLRAYDVANESVGGAEKVIKDPQTWQYNHYFPFYADAAKLLIEAKQGVDKKTTPATKLAALNRIYKSAASYRADRHLDGFFKSGDLWALCDGYRFVRLKEKPESIPEASGAFDLSRVVPENARDAEQVLLPSAAEIKLKIAESKAKYGKNWKLHPLEALPGWWCNPQYLLDMVESLPGAVAYRPEKYSAALYCESDDGDALLLPCRPPQAE